MCVALRCTPRDLDTVTGPEWEALKDALRDAGRMR
jgi:hypothetical protein